MKRQTDSSKLTVCFWNILLDDDRPSSIGSQSKRLPDIVKKLSELPEATIIGLAELNASNGNLIADKLGSRSKYIIKHSPQDYIGALSQLKFTAKTIDIDERCRAIVTSYKNITVVVVHLTFAVFGERIHKRQIKTLLENLDSAAAMVIMGDLNIMASQHSRNLFVKAGFKSALGRSIFKRLPTAPAKKYRQIYPEPFKTLGLIGFTLDDIYVRGLKVLDHGTIEGESDHLAVWAKLQISDASAKT